jgi:glycosyltransferase involved in cell wall biosynthesis
VPRDQLKVAHVVLGLQIGGLEMVVANLVRSSRSSPLTQFVLCLDQSGPLADQIAQDVSQIRMVRRQTPLDWTLAIRLALLARRLHIDVFHAHNFTPFMYASLSRLFGGPPVVATFHNTRPEEWRGKRASAMRFLSRRTTTIVAVSEKTGSMLEAMLGSVAVGRLSCISNGVAVDRFYRGSDEERIALRKELGFPGDARVIGSVGRLSPEKDYPTLVRAFQHLNVQNASARLAIAGDGPERCNLQNLVDSLGLQHRVRLAGARQDIDRFLSALDVFALSSSTEGTSIALLEAMASSLPIVATRVGGTIDLITPETDGILVESGNEQELAAAIQRVLSDQTLAVALGSNGRKTVEAKHSVEVMRDGYISIYRDAVNARHRRESESSGRLSR